jgi:epimerase transport system membrane fusion protein
MIAPKAPVPPVDSARGSIIIGVAVIALFFGVLGGWASVAPLNSAVVANAFVKVEGNRKSVEHLDGGIVQSIRVREGNRVAEGDVLVVLDETPLRAEVDVLDQQYALLRAIEARLNAERDGREGVEFPADLVDRLSEPWVAAAASGQRLEFANRRTAIEGQRQVIRQRVAQLESTIIGAEAQKLSFQEQVASIVAERVGLTELFNKGLLDRSRLLQLDRAESALRGQIGQADADIARARKAIVENTNQIDQFAKDQASEVAATLRETQSKLLDVAPRLRTARAALDRTIIRAPYSGTVVGLSVFSVGGVVARGQRILDIVPDGTPLVVEAQVAVADIAEVHPGAIAEVHFSAYKQRLLPIIHGTVTTISADRLTDERTGFAYYAASVEIDPRELAGSPEVQLYPGMPVTVMIPTGARTALAYLVAPLAESFDRAFRQR